MSCYIQSGVRLTPENKRISTDDDDDDDVVRHVMLLTYVVVLLKNPRDIQRPITRRRHFSVARAAVTTDFRFRSSRRPRMRCSWKQSGFDDCSLPTFGLRFTVCTIY